MKIHFWERPAPPHNFGDQLNRWLWPRLLPHLWEQAPPGVALVGLGTLLGRGVPLPADPVLAILGSGCGYGPPHRPDARWRVYGVRGPLTAGALGLAPSLAAGDPAILVSRADPGLLNLPRKGVGVMPHWRSANDAWEQVCAREGWTYLSPHAPVDTLLRAIGRCEVVVTEALHGAIVADACRVPWIPIESRPEILRFKWVDHWRTLRLDYRPVRVPALYANGVGGAWELRRAFRQRLLTRAIAAQLRRGRQVLSAQAQLAGLQAAWDARLAEFQRDAARLVAARGREVAA